MPLIVPMRFSQVNCYLLRKGGRTVLFDCGSPGDERRLIKALHDQGLAPEGIGLLVLSHAHADHSGNAEYLRKNHGLAIAMHAEDMGRPRPMRPRNVKGQMLLTAARAIIGAQQPIEPDFLLEDGLRLDAYGIPGEIVHLPGHTAGSVGLLLEDGRLLCGDMLMNFKSPALCHMAEDFSAARQSLMLLRAMGIATVYPGHGRPFMLSDMPGGEPLPIEEPAEPAAV